MTNKYTIAIIDDKYENLQYLTNILKSENYFIKASTNPDFALESFKIEPPDLILLDIVMPQHNGFDICKILKNDETFKDIPIIFISALDDLASKIQAFTEGGVDYITKPFEKDEILARVKTQLNLFNSKQAIKQLLEYQNFFLKKIIHEMNTPLSIISLNIDSLRSSIGEFEQFESIKVASKSLSSIYNDLYYLTKKETRDSQIKPINVVNFISSRISFFHEMLNIKNLNIDLEVYDEFSIDIDKYEFERIIDNTISNAIKYSYDDTIITIYLETKLDKKSISIENVGIPIVDTTSIFSPYFQQTNHNLGLGLGLSIVKEICDKNQITIQLTSNEERTTFEYLFPKDLLL